MELCVLFNGALEQNNYGITVHMQSMNWERPGFQNWIFVPFGNHCLSIVWCWCPTLPQPSSTAGRLPGPRFHSSHVPQWHEASWAHQCKPTRGPLSSLSGSSQGVVSPTNAIFPYGFYQ